MTTSRRATQTAEVWVEQYGSTSDELDRVLASVTAASSYPRTVIVIADPANEASARASASKTGAEVVLADDAALSARLAATAASSVVWIRGAVIRPTALERVEGVLARFPEVDVALADSQDTHGTKLRRPDESPLRLRSQDYLGPLVAFRVNAGLRIGGFRDVHPSVLLYDLALRMAESGGRFAVVPEVLTEEWTRSGDLERWKAERDVVDAALRAAGIEAQIESVGAAGRRIRYPLADLPLVSIIIPTRGTSADVAGRSRVLVVEAIRGILERSTYRNLEFVVVADSVTPARAIRDLRELAGDRLRLVEWDRPFNFSAKVNHGIAAARGEYLLVLNDDVDLVTNDWIETLLGLARQPGVGAVGAHLYFEDGSLQHAGHLYTGGSAGHVAFMEPGGSDDALRSLAVDREVSGVTGACLFVSAAIAHEVGGFSLELPSNYNDVDFCLKIRASGRRIVISPFVRLYHFESKSRDPRVFVEDTERLRRRWGSLLQIEMYSRMQVA